MKTGIIVAMDKEFSRLKTLIDNPCNENRNGKDFVSGSIGCNEVVIMQCGIGKVNSAIGTVEMIDAYHPDLVMSTGVAGGADVSLNITEVVVGTSYAYHDAYCGKECAYGQIMGMPAVFDSPSELVSKALSLDCGTPVHAGMIVSGEWFVDSTEKMRSILDSFPDAKAVDMESCSIAQTCHIYNTPFISFRIISDIPLKENNTEQYHDFWNRMAEGSFNVTKEYVMSL